MSLKNKIDQDLKTALLNKDELVSRVLRSLKATILNEEIVQGLRQTGLEDDAIEKIIQSEIKKHRDSIEAFSQAGRDDLVDSESQELSVLKKYLPEQLSEEELKSIISKLKSDNPDLQNGQIIGLVKKQVGAGADGATIAKLVNT